MKNNNLALITCILFFLFGTQTIAQDVNLEWAIQLGGTSIDRISDKAVDASGNIYTTGGFSETVDFDPGVGTLNLTSAGNYDIFIQKLDPEGNLLWVKQMGGTGRDYGVSIKVDASGNVNIVGDFEETVDFDPDVGTLNLSSAGGRDIFIQKLDPSGNLLWAKQMGGAGFDYSESLDVDNSGNVYASGEFEGTADFDPGVGTLNLTSAGDHDIFIQKLDSSGNLLWVKQIGGTNNDYCWSMVVDATGNVYTTGVFFGTVDFDPGAGSLYFNSLGYGDIFIQKLDDSGNLVWANQIGGSDGNEVSNSIEVDGWGNIYTTGWFEETVDFDPGAGTLNLTASGSNDVFILKIDSSGNLIWAKQMGGTNGGEGRSIAVDAIGNVYTTGEFYGTIDFDPGTGTHNLTSLGSSDIFIQKLDNSGILVWAKSLGGPDPDSGNSIIIDNSGNIYNSGSFNSTVDFDPEAEILNLSSAGSWDGFVLKLNDLSVGSEYLENDLEVSIYPNPTNDILQIKSEITFDHIRITNLLGQQVLSLENLQNSQELDISHLSPGVYMITFLSKNQIWTTEFIKQ